MYIGIAEDTNKLNKKNALKFPLHANANNYSKLADLCWNSTLKFLVSFTVKCTALPFVLKVHSVSPPPPPLLLNPSVHLSSPVSGEVKPDQLVGERHCLSLDQNEDVWKVGRVITISSLLHDRSSCLIKALKHNTSESGDNERVQRKNRGGIGIESYSKLVSL